MTLINGPYNGREIEDAGTVVVNMCIYDPCQRVGSIGGIARYEPSADRSLAFWEGNTWSGPIVAIVD
jgi:hypothetical protein